MRWAERCFVSLYKSTIKPDVYVVDNGSTDGTQAYIQNKYPDVFFVQSNKNLGFGKANNLGLQKAIDDKYDYVYLLNQDAWLMPDTLEKLVHLSMEHPEYGILSPFQIEANLKHIDMAFKKNVCSWKSSPDLIDVLYFNLLDSVIPVKSVMAAHWLITRKCLLQVGGFSPSFPHYGEDDNYIDRSIFHGFNVGIVPSTQAVHDRDDRVWTSKKMLYLGYTQTIRKISHPSGNQVNICKLFCETIKNSIKETSLLPYKYFFNLLLISRRLKKNRKISVNGICAFLKMPEFS